MAVYWFLFHRWRNWNEKRLSNPTKLVGQWGSLVGGSQILVGQLSKTDVSKSSLIQYRRKKQRNKVTWIKKCLLRSYSGISSETEMRKHDPCHQEAHSFLRRVKQTLSKQALDLKAGSSVENGECGVETHQWQVSEWWGAGIGKFPWRSEGISTLGFWPGEFQGPYSPWGRKELDMTERLSLSLLSPVTLGDLLAGVGSWQRLPP